MTRCDNSPPPTGAGLIAGGIIALVAGAVLIPTGVVQLRRGATTTEEEEDALFTGNGLQTASGAAALIFGLVGAIGGAAMLGYGVQRRREFTDWQRRHSSFRVAPSFARTRHGTWTVGVGIEF
ncbi:MAG TPA: hypothetical protein VGB85_07615 [Nannocystis sp.]